MTSNLDHDRLANLIANAFQNLPSKVTIIVNRQNETNKSRAFLGCYMTAQMTLDTSAGDVYLNLGLDSPFNLQIVLALKPPIFSNEKRGMLPSLFGNTREDYTNAIAWDGIERVLLEKGWNKLAIAWPSADEIKGVLGSISTLEAFRKIHFIPYVYCRETEYGSLTAGVPIRTLFSEQQLQDMWRLATA